MSIPTSTLETHLMGLARQRAAELLGGFATGVELGETLPALSSRASDILDAYCEGLLGGFLTAVVPAGDEEHDWVRRHYLPLVIEFGTAVRDAIADPTSRHAVAQTIQCKILEHERHLRIMLDERAGNLSEVLGPSSHLSRSPIQDSTAKL
jgi:hypothetical protein